MTKLQAIREFADFLANGHTTIARDRCDDGNWTMDLSNATPRLQIPKDLTYRDDNDKDFRKDFTTRCPLAKGFSDVTLAILHEFGHWYNRSVMNMVVYYAMVQSEENYFTNPYEVLATQWAICWLLCPTNRKVAKNFEKKYFGRV